MGGTGHPPPQPEGRGQRCGRDPFVLRHKHWARSAAGPSPRGFAVVVAQREQLLLHPVPPLQAAPQPVGVDHVQPAALLRLAHLLRACAGRGAQTWAPPGAPCRVWHAPDGPQAEAGQRGLVLPPEAGAARAFGAQHSPPRGPEGSRHLPARAAIRWVALSGASGSSTSWVRILAPRAVAW